MKQESFPKLAIGESGQFYGETVKRISTKLYKSTHNEKLTYGKAELVSILDPRPIKLAYRNFNS